MQFKKTESVYGIQRNCSYFNIVSVLSLGEKETLMIDKRTGRMRCERREKLPARTKRRKPMDLSLSAREIILLVREGLVQSRELAINAREQRGRQKRSIDANAAIHIAMLRQANSHLVIASIEAVKLAEQVQHAKVELDFLASHDVLTKLPNRILLGDRLKQAIEFARGCHGLMAIMFVDLDRFKHINDSLGHAVGDQLLQAVAHRLMTCVRSSDTVSRQGGDEFVLLLPLIEHAADAAAIAQKILLAMALPYTVEHHLLYLGVSIGVSLYPQDGLDAETLIGNADLAMYHVKDTGRNNYAFFTAAMNARAILRQSIEVGLRQALARHEFVLHYQPKIALRSGMLVGVEALVRWQHPQRGLLSPQHFIAIAEECGLILPLGRWVLRRACEQAREWSLRGWPPMIMAVNTSPLEFGALDFMSYLCRTLDETGLHPAYLELELTESTLMRNTETSDSLLQNIADLGVKLAIDDFGTGYSSLSYLTQFPIHTLKIDQSFVSQMSSNADDATIVSAVIGMGKSLKKRIIAEGVETQEQCAFLKAQGCDEGQGYFFGRPTDAEGIVAMLRAGQHEPCRPPGE
jgi:diguanylate cyclase (GGDEF)-like protein